MRRLQPPVGPRDSLPSKEASGKFGSSAWDAPRKREALGHPAHVQRALALRFRAETGAVVKSRCANVLGAGSGAGEGSDFQAPRLAPGGRQITLFVISASRLKKLLFLSLWGERDG